MYDMLTIKSKKASADMVLIKICENILIVCVSFIEMARVMA